MGLTNTSTGTSISKDDIVIIHKKDNDNVIALAGNPNVGKSTIFNGLTGLKQHTGNWPGKTVANAVGNYQFHKQNYILVDIPGTYSLMSSSKEEQIARDFICFGQRDAVIIVVDATCLERNLNLVLQTLEATSNVIVCVNLLDEAKKKKIEIDLKQLEVELGVSVVGTTARSKKGFQELMQSIEEICNHKKTTTYQITYPENIENYIRMITPLLQEYHLGTLDPRWVSMKLLDLDSTLEESLTKYLGYNLLNDPCIRTTLEHIHTQMTTSDMKDSIVSSIVKRCEEIYQRVVTLHNTNYHEKDKKIDKLLTSKKTGIPIMLVLLSIIFWITISGANYPSEILSQFLFQLEPKIALFLEWLHAPFWLINLIVDGAYRTLAWVVSVMLPPMAIFFPLFTLLEDSGYLPRIAFNMDKLFKKACAHGKQALTMCMGFGCNACGVIGCRIIESPREKMIAMITNNFVPCNGRFPTLIAIITMFFVGSISGPWQSIFSTLLLITVIIIGVIMTLTISKILSKTILKGLPSSFTLELPPYRKPQVGKVIIRSIFDRTLFVLGRAIIVAIPAGVLIWILANIELSGISLLTYCTDFLDPFAHIIGLDGVILMAFILGFPANEIVIPIIIMSYLSTGSLIEFDNILELKTLLIDNGWTMTTAICTMLFSLFHWPCSTTCLTIKKETKSTKWTIISFLVPTLTGIIICFLVATTLRFFGI